MIMHSILRFFIHIAEAKVTIPKIDPAIGFTGFISNLYDTALAVVGACVFVMFLWGGIQWMVSGVSDKKAAAKEIMKRAVIGAIILVSAVLILRVINPDLVKNQFDFQGAGGAGAPAGQNP
ncbi:MAG: hypothetical protein CEN90_166 [Parcubacteria group bacterium Licking1014_17]|nr:MAG: hypothetical protein CEN90_166 [Parcubacteria group bacterium Licking1014_17]